MPVDAPDPVRAVSLGLALLKAARVETWDDLVASLGPTTRQLPRLDGIELTRADLELLDAHLGLLGLIRVVPGTRGRGLHGHRRGLRQLRPLDAQHRDRATPLPAHLGCPGRW